MDVQPLYDLAPLTRLMLLGLLIALGPLAWVRWRNRGASPLRRLQALTALILFLTFDLIVVGAFTRLTDSGLGCPDWPGCYGELTPWGAKAEISAAQAAQPTGPVTHGKAWIEMVHRYLAMAVGALILVAAAMSWRARAQLPHSPWWATATLLWVLVQGAFGKYTVTLKLYPAVVTLHLLGAQVLLALLVLQHESFRARALQVARQHVAPAWVAVVLALVVVQIALGGWVSTNYAVLACQGFPTCNGQWWPSMDAVHGFTLLRHLLASGLSNVVLGWPIVAALAHSAGAAGLVAVLVSLWARLRLAPGVTALASSAASGARRPPAGGPVTAGRPSAS
jgi:cytochrome c oxidase assembly protein subunit 15